MRLRVMQDILKENIKGLEVNATGVGGSEYKIVNFVKLNTALENLSEFQFLKNEMLELGNTTVFHNKSETVIVNDTRLKELRRIVRDIALKVITVIDAIDEAIPVQNVDSLSIKLPNYSDLPKVADFIKEINTILNQTLVGNYQGTIKLQNFDTGSNWIEIVLGNPEAIVYFGFIYRTVTQLFRTEYLKLKQAEHTVRLLEIDEKAKELVLKGLENDLKTKAELNAKMVMDKANITENQNEYQSNLTRSILRLTELVSAGAEVHTALNAPEEAKSAFPDEKETKVLIENVKAYITDGSAKDIEAIENNEDTQQPKGNNNICFTLNHL